jgi:hypothetical protein
VLGISCRTALGKAVQRGILPGSLKSGDRGDESLCGLIQPDRGGDSGGRRSA